MNEVSTIIAASSLLPDGGEEGWALRARRAMPKPLKGAYRAVSALQSSIGAWLYDARRFSRHSGTFNRDGDAHKIAAITKSYHMIEKGLALPRPRPGFGRIVNQDLCAKIQSAIESGIRDPEIQHAVDALAGYRDFNREHGIQNGPWIEATIALAIEHGIEPHGHPIKAPLERAQGMDNLDFVWSRHSVRHFSADDVPEDVLRNATRAAQSAPCVCNRQSGNVYFVKDAELRKKMLAQQNGNRGFGDTAPVVALVTVDLRNFLDASERYQAWIDGGLFAMNLLLGIHAQGYGACCLNWSALPRQDRAVRKLGIIAEHETVIMMVAIGAPKEGLVVARSARRPVERVMRIL